MSKPIAAIMGRPMVIVQIARQWTGMLVYTPYPQLKISVFVAVSGLMNTPKTDMP